MTPREIIILAGGLGTRLSSTHQGPKCLAKIDDRPFLFFLINYYRGQGLQKFIFSLGYGHAEVEAYLQASFPDLDYEMIIEEEQLDTGGAIAVAMKAVQENTVLVVNGDTYFRISLSPMAGFHHMCGAECSIALKEIDNTERYGSVKLNTDYSVETFTEKGIRDTGFINGGAYLLNKRLFLSHEFPVKFSFEKDYLQQYIKRARIFGVKQNGYFIDIGIPEDLERAQQEMPAYESKLDK
jgi:D-glycero-alpha-D-manno-heptose 1-phosphate guanylyltransferase